MRKILYLVTEDWFFVSHFSPMGRRREIAACRSLSRRARRQRAARGGRVSRDQSPKINDTWRDYVAEMKGRYFGKERSTSALRLNTLSPYDVIRQINDGDTAA